MTAATLTLTEFLLARIAEDEAQLRGESCPCFTEHMAVDCPQRVRADCEAKRRIVELVDPWTCKPDAAVGAPGCRDDMVLGLLAAVYADHPDYREEWKP